MNKYLNLLLVLIFSCGISLASSGQEIKTSFWFSDSIAMQFKPTVYSHKGKEFPCTLYVECTKSKAGSGFELKMYVPLDGHFSNTLPKDGLSKQKLELIDEMQESLSLSEIEVLNGNGEIIDSQKPAFFLDSDSSSLVAYLAKEDSKDKINIFRSCIKIALSDQFTIEKKDNTGIVVLADNVVLIDSTVNHKYKTQLIMYQSVGISLLSLVAILKFRKLLINKRKSIFVGKGLMVDMVKEKIANGRLHEALDIVMQNTKETRTHNEVLYLKCWLTRIEESQRLGILDNSSCTLEINKIAWSLIQTIELANTRANAPK